MNDQMLNSIMSTLRGRRITVFRPAAPLEICPLDNVCEGRYEKRGEYRPFDGFENGNSSLRCKIEIPRVLVSDGEYRDYIMAAMPGREGHFIVGGEHYQGVDSNRSLIPVRGEWAGKTLDVEIITKGDGGRCDFIGTVTLDEAINSFLVTLGNVISLLRLENGIYRNGSRTMFVKLRSALDDALLSFDCTEKGDALHESVKAAHENLKTVLAKIDSGDSYGSLALIGHTHIDVAWLWQLKDTVRKCGHTFPNMLRLMDEYPDFTFSCSQLQLMDYTKRFYPEVFEQIKARVADGRWEIVGPMWVESDCNVTSGESLVRQVLYGAGFSDREFGAHSHVAWLPDTFGFQPNLPQIFKKSGTEHFYSYKLHWQAQNRFPYGMFRWQGLDGSEIVCSVTLSSGGYNGEPNPDQYCYATEHNLQSGVFDDVIFPYGYGDGGGGPTREMIENERSLEAMPGVPKSRLCRADEYFDKLDEHKSSLPVWFGELYIETHRGTLTSQGHSKRNNRTAELTYQAAEKLGAAAELTGCVTPDFSLLNEGWKRILLMQFHDVLPGSSIREVYGDDSARNYGEIFELRDAFIAKVVGEGEKTGDIAVYNPLSWERDTVIRTKAPDGFEEKKLSPRDSEGRELPYELIRGEDSAEILIETGKLPALGSKLIRFSPSEKAAVKGEKLCKIETAPDGLRVESPDYVIRVDSLGRLSGMYDKREGREVVKSGSTANDIRMFIDGPQEEDAWNLYEDYKKRECVCDWKVKLSVRENDSLRTVIAVEKSIDGCVINQDIVIEKTSKDVKFVTDIDWSLRHRVLRVYFPMGVRSQTLACETGFGTYLRPAVATDPYEKAKFEFCAHKFADLSDSGYGAALLNDCKYAHDVNGLDSGSDGGTIGLTLLRGTTHPDPEADIGHHTINYSLYPHKGAWNSETALTPRAGFELNVPAKVYPASEVFERLEGLSLAVCDCPNIIIDTFKPAEDGDGYILRAYECLGGAGKCGVRLMKAAKYICECDLLEKPLVDLTCEKPASGGRFDFEFTPYEILTYRVKF